MGAESETETPTYLHRLEDIHSGVSGVALLALVSRLARRSLLTTDAIHSLQRYKKKNKIFRKKCFKLKIRSSISSTLSVTCFFIFYEIKSFVRFYHKMDSFSQHTDSASGPVCDQISAATYRFALVAGIALLAALAAFSGWSWWTRRTCNEWKVCRELVGKKQS